MTALETKRFQLRMHTYEMLAKYIAKLELITLHILL